MILCNGTEYLDCPRSTLYHFQQKMRPVCFVLGGQNETLLHFAAREAHEKPARLYSS